MKKRKIQTNLKPLPRLLHLEGFTFHIKLVKGLRTSRTFMHDDQSYVKQAIDASIDHIAQIIRIDKSLTLEQQWESLLHELLHFVLLQEQLQQVPYREEAHSRISQRLFGILRSNNLYP